MQWDSLDGLKALGTVKNFIDPRSMYMNESRDESMNKRSSCEEHMKESRFINDSIPIRNRIIDKTETLGSETAAVHKAYLELIQGKDEEISFLKRNISSLKQNMMIMSKHFAIDVSNIQQAHDALEDTLGVTNGELSMYEKSEKEWIGRTLKLKFVLDEIRKIGALPKDHAEWVEPMVDDIEIPDVSINVRDRFVPTAQTDNIDWDSSEDDDEDEDEEYDEYDEYEVDWVSRILWLDSLEDRTPAEEFGVITFSDLSLIEILNHIEFPYWRRRVRHIRWPSMDLDIEFYGFDEGTMLNVLDGVEGTMLNVLDDVEGTMLNIFNARTDRWMVCHYNYPQDVLEQSARTIQKYWLRKQSTSDS